MKLQHKGTVFSTGDSVRYLPGETVSAYAIGDLNPDTLVYIIVTGRDTFKVATSAANAASNTVITLDSYASSGKTFPVVWQQEVSAEMIISIQHLNLSRRYH